MDQESISGTVENSNINILGSIDNYLQYIRDNIKQIIIDDDLKYSDPMDKKKIYPAFTYTQFLYLLGRLYDRVYSQNLELLQEPPYTKPLLYNNSNTQIRYNIAKVELAYKVYNKLCAYYGYVVSVEPFSILTGIEVTTFKEWLSSGRTNLLNKMIENNKASVVTGFENSRTPLLKLAAGNYKFKLNTPEQTQIEQAATDTLPDLLQLAKSEKMIANKDQE